MVSVVWLILSFFDVCNFTWLPIFIDSIIALGVFMFTFEGDDSLIGQFLTNVPFGVALFSFLKLFCSLSISTWWILLSPLAFLILFLVPGGFTIFNLLFRKFGLLVLPTWVLVVGIVIDVISLIFSIVEIVQSRK